MTTAPAPSPEETDTSSPSVSILIPALNEEDTIAEVIRRVLAVPISKQVIVIDDGSTDNTAAELAQFSKDILLLSNPKPTGKGSAIRKALDFAVGTVCVVQDADLEYRPEELPQVVAPILENRAQVVLGSRFTHGMPHDMAFPNKVVNILLAWSVRIIYWRKISDEATCYKAIRTDILKKMNLQCKRFEFCPEVVAKSCRLGESLLEVPITYTPRTKAAGKKIRWTDAPEAFWTLLRYRFWKPK